VVAVGAGVAVVAVLWAAVWWGATPLLLRSLGVTEVDEDDQARVFNQVEGLCATLGLVVPRVCVVDDAALGALVLGRRRRLAVMVVTTGLAQSLDPVQLEAVLAHELVHVRRGEVVPATMAAAVALPFTAVLPGAPELVHRLSGRGREFLADQQAVRVTRYPPGLRQALALMVDGPVPAPASPLAGRGSSSVMRWLWTVRSTALGSPDGARGEPGELDEPVVRIAALDEW